jgi:uncharacterized protein (DUF885 family)
MTTDSLFSQLLQDEWEARLRYDPLLATISGDRRYNDRLQHVHPEDYARRLEQLKGFLQRLEAIPCDELTPGEQLNYKIFRRVLQDAASQIEYPGYYFPICKTGGFHVYFPELFENTPFENAADYENYIARLWAFQEQASEYIELMRNGMKRGYAPSQVTLEGVDKALQAQIVQEAEKSPLYAPFRQFPPTVNEDRGEQLQAAGRAAILGSVSPGYQKLLAFLDEEYLPGARQSIAASNLPDGHAFYDQCIRYHTTLDLTPEQVHQIGLQEVQRIHEEMDAVITKTGFTGSRRAFIEFLRTEARFYPQTDEQLLKETAYVLKRMDGELPRLFKTLPRMTYGLRPVPVYASPAAPGGYYNEPTADGKHAGIYYVNTYDLKSHALYDIEALSLHEAVPGHHFQIARQMELDLPMFRRYTEFNAYVEGWALYAERLGLEVGMYKDPYSNFGRLSSEMWRACRLVIDTGVHALGWTRQQAIDFLVENVSSSRLEIVNEVDRYIAWPGQALAYKIGELKIRELRQIASAALGLRFDLREFHDLVLGCGAVPLDLLENIVSEWIKKQSEANA